MNRLWPSRFTIVLASACMMLVGCAYFNTYYNASTSYDGARRAHRKLESDSSRSTDQLTLPPKIVAGYDTAIAKSLKVLQNFPRSVKWHDDAIFLIARSLYYKGEYQRAQRRFRQLIEEQPTSPFVPQAYLYLGKSYLYDDNLSKAEEILSFVLAKYPSLDQNKEVSTLMAEIAIRRGGKALAIELLEKARASTRDEVRKLELHLQIATLYIDLKRYSQAQKLLETAPRVRNRPDLVYQVDHLLVVCASEQNQLEHAFRRVNFMSRNSRYYRYMAEILFQKGTIQDKMGRVDDAITTFEQLVARYPASTEAGKGWFSLGMIYQKKRGDYERAAECFTKAIELLRDESLKAIALERRDAIRQIARFRAGKPDSTQAGQDTIPLDDYRLGEIFWLRLDEPDSALVQFTAIAADTSSSPEIAAKSLYAIGWIHMSVKKDSARADSVLSLLESRYPQTAYAPKGQELRGKRITLFTRSDSALQAYLRAEERLFDADDPTAAIDEYLLVYKKYSDLEVGRKALYAAAWLNDFVLQKNRTAFTLYRELCDSFPDSDLCKKAAEPRLKAVRDSLRIRKASQPTPPPKEANIQQPPRRPGRAGAQAGVPIGSEKAQPDEHDEIDDGSDHSQSIPPPSVAPPPDTLPERQPYPKGGSIQVPPPEVSGP